MTTGADAHSIASLLPYGLRVIVAGRPNPPLPADVPEDHPLRTAVVRTLAPSPKAHAIRTEAERELKRLLEAGGLPYDLLAHEELAAGAREMLGERPAVLAVPPEGVALVPAEADRLRRALEV
ncbi:hypothetical protein ACIO8G_25900 [Streptomyces sp. NPDC087219]|uniref:hypothetical protein n=1 Tax=Streptomyces sp. NPDC087219 TaxID=3365770 RepID=UPI0038123D8C